MSGERQGFDDRPPPAHIPSMRRTVAILAFATLTSSQLVALRCDMGAPAHHAAATHEAASAHGTATHEGAPAHRAATHEAASAHDAAGHETGRAHDAAAHQTASRHGDHPAPHHADRDACLMMMACGTASIRAVRTVAVARISAPFVRAASSAPAIPVAADLAVETPPPRLTV